MSAMFRSLSGINYRLWFGGALVSNIGTWMQRTAQDWIVLTMLTDNDAVAVGITMALQLGPQLLLVPWSGLIADRFDRRKLLMLTQSLMAALGVALGLMVLFGVAELWHVYAFAFALGVVSAIDAPARQAFVSELVSEKDLPNAVSLNSASFNAARLVGPAVAGVLTVAVGAGWVFLINAITFAATFVSLALLRRDKLRVSERAPREPGQLLEGFRYVAKRPDIIAIMVAVFIVGTFGLNFAIFTATMARVEFDHGAGEFGLLSSVLAIGSVTGALLSARREKPRMLILFSAAAAFGVSCAISAVMPTFTTFALALILVGFSSITFMTTANSMVQTTTEPVMRGRVMALYMAIFMGGTPIGAPVVGWVSNEFGPRWALGVGAASGILAALVGVVWMVVSNDLRVHRHPTRRIRFVISHSMGRLGRADAAAELALDETVARKA
ncbi:MFS family permease [Conyzicola lurida]|uniref:MFS family permease n=1 Tax=Conyzicola lurida TaxID=1172621 RepID=A0A841ALA5_9MICO|nr:MFS transporter [Conyzicola lurida]MBB5844750.1 MFS family permease [Conyzicola lurida]